MNYTEKDLEKIDAYITHPGRNGDPPKLSSMASEDPMLKAAFHDVEMLWQATRLEKLQGKLEMLKRFEAELKSDTPGHKNISIFRRRTMQWVIGAAAVILVLVTVAWLLFRQEPDLSVNTYLAENISTYILHDGTKGNAPVTYTDEQLAAFNLFAIGEFREAERSLSRLWLKQRDHLALYYLIASHIGQGERQKAIELLNAHRPALSSQEQQLLDDLLQHE